MARIEGLPVHLEMVPPAPDGPDDPLRDQKRAAFLTWRRDVMEYRVKRRADLRADPGLRAFELRYCANSPAYFAAMWLTVKEPRNRKTGAGDLPFIPFAKQVDFWDVILNVVLKSEDENADATWSKSRGWGASWAGVLLAYWGWLFSHRWPEKQPWSVLFLSRKEDCVDSKQSKSLFWKIREMIAQTPDWMLPKGWDPKLHLQKMICTNPENGNELTGESTNTEAARGDRITWAWIDEAAAMDEDVLESIYSSAGGATDHRIVVSTESFEHGDAWYRLRTGKDADYKPHVITADWWENPLNDDEWYERTKKRWANDPSKFEWEYLRNPWAGNMVPWVYPAAQAMVVDYDIKPRVNRPTFLSADPGGADPTALVLGQQTEDGGVDWIAAYSNQRMPAEFYAPLLKPDLFGEGWEKRSELTWTATMGEPQTFEYGFDEIEFAKLVAECGKPTYVGDTHGDKMEGVSADTVYGRWHRYGIHINRDRLGQKDLGAYASEARTFEGRHQALRERLGKWRFGPKAQPILQALQHYQFKPNDRATTTRQSKPLHNWASHYATACEYLAVYLRRKGAIDKRVYQKPVRNSLYGLPRGSRGLDRSLSRTP